MPHFTRCMNLSRLFQLKTDYSKDSYISMYGYIEKIALDASSTGTVGEGATLQILRVISATYWRDKRQHPEVTMYWICGRACHSHSDNSYSTTKTVRLSCKQNARLKMIRTRCLYCHCSHAWTVSLN